MDVPLSVVIDYSGGAHLAPGVPAERSVLTEAARSALPAGTITIDADECIAVAVGDGTFMDTGLDGSFPAAGAVVLPAYIVAGPGLAIHLPGGTTMLAAQDAVDAARCDFRAVDAEGILYRWDDAAGGRGFEWEAAGSSERTPPVFPVTAWRM